MYICTYVHARNPSNKVNPPTAHLALPGLTSPFTTTLNTKYILKMDNLLFRAPSRVVGFEGEEEEARLG